MKEKIEIGKIVKARGLDGTLKVLSGFLPSDFVNLKQVEIDNNFFDVEKLSGKQGSLFVKLKSIKSIERTFASIFKVGKYGLNIRKYSTHPVINNFINAATHVTRL